MSRLTFVQQHQTDPLAYAPSRRKVLQRKCACGQHTHNHGECDNCHQKQIFLQRNSISIEPVTASLLREEGEDPIHQPMIENFRREQGLPPDGIDESGIPMGPSAAEIKYGDLLLSPPSSVSTLFFVSFQNVSPPSAPDHSQIHPGPGGAIVNRAGYTRVRLRKRMTIPWDTLPAQAGGQIPLFAQSVNVFYRLDPIEVFVSSNYGTGSCPYRATLMHERSHVRGFLRLFHAARSSLKGQLNQVAVPTRSAPQLVQPGNIEATQNTIGNHLRQVVVTHSVSLVRQMEADRDAKDLPASYASVYAQCPSREW